MINSYINCLKDPITKKNIELFDESIVSELDKGFLLYLQNAPDIDRVMG